MVFAANECVTSDLVAESYTVIGIILVRKFFDTFSRLLSAITQHASLQLQKRAPFG